MRVIEKAVYKYSELSPEAKEHAREAYCSEEGYNWSMEAIDSIKALAEHFGGRLADYSIAWEEPGRSSLKWDMPDDMSIKEIGERLKQLGSYNKRTGKGHGECKLTGVCFDENAIDGFRQAWRSGERDLGQLMHHAGEELLSACCQDYEYQQSAEAFAESCEANEWEFDENGDMV